MKSPKAASYEIRVILLLGATLAFAICGWGQTSPTATKPLVAKQAGTNPGTMKPPAGKPANTTTASHKPAGANPDTSKSSAARASTTQKTATLKPAHSQQKAVTPGKEITKGSAEVGIGLVNGA